MIYTWENNRLQSITVFRNYLSCSKVILQS